jgi:hypothetical protein
MARLNDDAQWIVLMGFLVSFSLFFLAIVINQSTVVGQTTAESVIEFPKNDIRDVRSVIIQSVSFSSTDLILIHRDIEAISMSRKSAIVNWTTASSCVADYSCMQIHYNNGVTEYNENWISP